MTDLINLPASLSSVPSAALDKVTERLPEISKKTKAFGRSNSQTTLSLMSLTMLCGQSPHRQVRQILAEIDKRRAALAEAQVSYAELQVEEIDKTLPDNVYSAKERLHGFNLEQMETSVAGAVKDIAALIEAYDRITAEHGITDWAEADFEAAEARHHVRRGFELLYRDIITVGRPKEATVEYLQQFGVHIQLAVKEVTGYTMVVEERIANGGRPTASDIEDFLDAMADKYDAMPTEVAKRIFGTDQAWTSKYTQGAS
jgi:hypothetical protein